MTRFRILSRVACMTLALSMAAVPSLAEDEEITLSDATGLIWEEATYDDVTWNFPVDLSDMDPEMVRLANKEVRLDKSYVPDPLVTMKRRKANSDGSNANGGVNKASSSEMKLQGECAEALVNLFEARLTTASPCTSRARTAPGRRRTRCTTTVWSGTTARMTAGSASLARAITKPSWGATWCPGPGGTSP